MKLVKLNKQAAVAEGVRMSPSAFSKALDASRFMMGFELEFLIGEGYRALTKEAGISLSAEFEGYDENDGKLTKERFAELFERANAAVVKENLMAYLTTTISDMAGGFSGADEKLQAFLPAMGMSSAKELSDRIRAYLDDLTEDSDAWQQIAISYEDEDGGPEKFVRDVRDVLAGKNIDDENDTFSQAMYDLNIPELFDSFDATKMTDEAFNDALVDRYNSYSHMYTRVFSDGGPTTSNAYSNARIARFLEEKADIKVKDTSDTYHGAARLYGEGGHGYYLEQDGPGPELVSDPMPLRQAEEELKRILAVIEQYFATDESRGLHINVSAEGLDRENIDLLKLLLFLGEDHLLSQFGRKGNRYTKSQLQNFIGYVRTKAGDNRDQFFSLFTGPENDERRKAVNADIAERITMWRDDAKHHTFNILKLLKKKDPYIEFRIMGNEGYEKKFNEISNQLNRYAYAMQLAMDPSAEREEYAKKLWKFIERADVEPSPKDLMATTAFGSYILDAVTFQLRFKSGSVSEVGIAAIDGDHVHQSMKRLDRFDEDPNGFRETNYVIAVLGIALVFMHQAHGLGRDQKRVLRRLREAGAKLGIDARNTEKMLRAEAKGMMFYSNTIKSLDDGGTLTFGGKTYTKDTIDELVKRVANTGGKLMRTPT